MSAQRCKDFVPSRGKHEKTRYSDCRTFGGHTRIGERAGRSRKRRERPGSACSSRQSKLPLSPASLSLRLRLQRILQPLHLRRALLWRMWLRRMRLRWMRAWRLHLDMRRLFRRHFRLVDRSHEGRRRSFPGSSQTQQKNSRECNAFLVSIAHGA